MNPLSLLLWQTNNLTRKKLHETKNLLTFQWRVCTFEMNITRKKQYHTLTTISRRLIIIMKCSASFFILYRVLGISFYLSSSSIIVCFHLKNTFYFLNVLSVPNIWRIKRGTHFFVGCVVTLGNYFCKHFQKKLKK